MRCASVICSASLTLLGSIVAACSYESRAQVQRRIGVQRIVAIDLSSSRDSAQLADSKAFATQVLDGLQYGDEIVFQHVYERGLTGPVRFWYDSTPVVIDAAEAQSLADRRLERLRRAARAELPIFFDPKLAGKIAGTDMTSTLFRVADIARGAGGRRTTVYLLSDMLQWTPDLNLEEQLPPKGWVDNRKRRGLIPQLPNVCVVAIGPDVTTDHGVAVRQFWQEYFTAAGASLREENYRNSAQSIVGLGC